MGTPRFAVPSLEILSNRGEEIAAVVTRPDKPSGRGQQVVPSPVKACALRRGFSLLQPAKMKDAGFLGELKRLNADLVVVVAFGRILPAEVLKIPRLGCVNLHASLLPKYRGAAPIQWAVINGETETGVTTMVMDEGMDTGPILLQEKTAIPEEETAGRLAERLSVLGSELLARTVKELGEGALKALPQDDSQASLAPMLKKEDGRIEWTRQARPIYNLIRGADPWPGAFTHYQGRRWRILRARIIDAERRFESPARILQVEKDEVHVATGGGILAILELQPENGRRMTVREYLAGHAVRPGALLGES